MAKKVHGDTPPRTLKLPSPSLSFEDIDREMRGLPEAEPEIGLDDLEPPGTMAPADTPVSEDTSAEDEELELDPDAENAPLPSLPDLPSAEVFKPKKPTKFSGTIKVPAKLQRTLPGEIVFPDSVPNPDKIKELCSDEEIRIFIQSWNRYFEEFGEDMTRSSDIDDLEELCLCYVDNYRIAKIKRKNANATTDPAVDRASHNIHIRITNLKKSLRTTRRDRKETEQDDKHLLVKILAESAKNRQAHMQQQVNKLKELESEETDALSKKAERGPVYE